MKLTKNQFLGEKPHSCAYCGASFTTYGEMTRHVKYKVRSNQRNFWKRYYKGTFIFLFFLFPFFLKMAGIVAFNRFSIQMLFFTV
jgi:hypothetical protein